LTSIEGLQQPWQQLQQKSKNPEKEKGGRREIEGEKGGF